MNLMEIIQNEEYVRQGVTGRVAKCAKYHEEICANYNREGKPLSAKQLARIINEHEGLEGKAALTEQNILGYAKKNGLKTKKA